MCHTKRMAHFYIKRIVVCILFCACIVTGGHFYVAYAQSTALNQAQDDRAKLQAELDQLQQEIAQKEDELKNQKGQSLTLQNQITILKNEITKDKLNIKAKNIIIANLGGQITDRENKIETLQEKIDREHQSLAQLIRKTQEMDDDTMVHLLLSDGTLSDFYKDIDTFGTLKASIQQSVNTIRGVTTETEQEKQSLEDEQNKQLDAKAAIVQAQKSVEQNQAEQNKLLSFSKDKEKQFEKDIADKQARAGQIRAALFQFAGGTAAIPFDQALTIAQLVSQKTGVRPAFLLAIIKQETNLGANQGQCYVRNFTTGSGVNKKTNASVDRVMNTKSIPIFLNLTAALGVDPAQTIVSCPLSYGYGGAMGPSQFIPTTWILYADRVASALGDTPNPWNAKDAFMASGFLLSDNGASPQTYSAERNAACRYYSGNKCGVGSAPNTFYGNQVMAKATSIQSDIDYINQYGTSK